MKLRSLELRNYRKHQRTVIEWPDGVLAVLGRNGAGKSSILESIGFALFGVPATRTGKDLLRWDGAGPMDSVGVALEFELAGEAIRVHRELRGKGLTPSATLTVDGRVAVDPGAGSNEAVTQEIERRFGMDRETFFTTLVANQGDLDRLSGMTPAKRKQLLLEMLGIDALDRAIDRARQERRDLETRIDAMRKSLPDDEKLKQAIADAKQRVAEAQAKTRVTTESWANCKTELEKAAAEWQTVQAVQAKHDEATRNLERAQQTLDQITGQLQDLQAQVEAAEAAKSKEADLAPLADQLPQLEAQWLAAQSAAQAMQRVASLQAEVSRLEQTPSKSMADVQAALDAAQAERESLNQRIALVESKATHDAKHLQSLQSLGGAAECPTCLRSLDDHLPDLVGRLEASNQDARLELEALRKDLPGVDARLQALRADVERARALDQVRARLAEESQSIPADVQSADPVAVKQELDQARAAHEERLRLHAAIEALPGILAKRENLQSATADAKAAVDAAIDEVAQHPIQAEIVEATRKRHASTVEAEREAERAHLAAQHANELASKDLENAEHRRAEAKAQLARLHDVEEDARYWAALASGRGKGMLESFKAHLVGRIGPAIGREASRLIERFTGGRYTEITLDAEYNVYVSDGGKHYTLDRFSGGESDLVHLAIRLAVSRLLVERSSAEMRFLALDEVFGSLDEERRHLVLAALQELGSLYSQVMLVTHHDSLRDALDASLLVEERDGAAVVSLHGG